MCGGYAPVQTSHSIIHCTALQLSHQAAGLCNREVENKDTSIRIAKVETA